MAHRVYRCFFKVENLHLLFGRDFYFLSLEEECEEGGSLNIPLEGGLYGKGFLYQGYPPHLPNVEQSEVFNTNLLTFLDSLSPIGMFLKL
jgi:hypothetical protein